MPIKENTFLKFMEYLKNYRISQTYNQNLK